MNKRISSDGQSLILTLVMTAVMAILLSSFAFLIASQTRERRAVSEAIAAVYMQNLISIDLSNPAICAQMLTSSNVTGSLQPAGTVGIAKIFASAAGMVLLQPGSVSPMAPTLTIAPNGIRLNITSATSGTLTVTFNQAGLIRPLNNLSIPLNLTNASGTVNGCSFGGSGGAGVTAQSCPAGQFATGVNTNGTLSCTSNGSQAGAPCSGPGGQGFTSYIAGYRCCYVPPLFDGSEGSCYYF